MATHTPAAELQDTDEAKLALEGLEGIKNEEGDKGEGVKTEEEKAAEAAEAAEAEKLKPVEKADGTMENAEEAKARVDAEAEAAKEPTELERLRAEVKDVHQMLRTSKREQVQDRAKLDRLEKRPVKVVKEDEDEEGEGETGEAGKKKVVEEEPLSRVEELQETISQIGKDRGPSLDILLATMEQGEKYKDIREVCSRGNFDDIFEAIASESSKDSGKNYDETLLEVEASIWAKENPYQYMYDLIQKYHPSYAKQEGAAAPDDKGGKGKEKHTVAEAPGSIADKGGDSSVKSGWTAKRIGDLPEDELDTVPKDVYDKYMLGELD